MATNTTGRKRITTAQLDARLKKVENLLLIGESAPPEIPKNPDDIEIIDVTALEAAAMAAKRFVEAFGIYDVLTLPNSNHTDARIRLRAWNELRKAVRSL